jgi:TPR repeat protein
MKVLRQFLIAGLLVGAGAAVAQEAEPTPLPTPAAETPAPPAEAASPPIAEPPRPVEAQPAAAVVVPAVAAPTSAASLLQRAEQGNPGAQYTLGVLYVNGDADTKTNYDQAARWFLAAARSGNLEARRHLVFMKEMGLASIPDVPAIGDATFRVQVASVPNEGEAVREWRRMQRRFPDALGALQSQFAAFDAPDGSKIYRVQGGPLDEETARATCAKLRTDGATCFVIRPQSN